MTSSRGHSTRLPRGWTERASLAVALLRNDFLPFARETLNILDWRGESEPMDKNAALRVVLEYGALRALINNCLEGITFPQCLPEEVVDALKEAGRAEIVAEQRQEFRAENMVEWILVNKLHTTQEAWNAVRKLVPGYVMPSLNETAREAASLVLQYCHRVRWIRKHSREHICGRATGVCPHANPRVLLMQALSKHIEQLVALPDDLRVQLSVSSGSVPLWLP